MQIPKLAPGSCVPSGAPAPRRLPRGIAQNPHDPFSPGETLTYDVMWTIFRAGEVTATLRDQCPGNHDAYEVTATARSEGFVSSTL